MAAGSGGIKIFEGYVGNVRVSQMARLRGRGVVGENGFVWRKSLTLPFGARRPPAYTMISGIRGFALPVEKRSEQVS